MKILAVTQGYSLATYECRDIVQLKDELSARAKGFSEKTIALLGTTLKEGTRHPVCNTRKTMHFRKVYGLLGSDGQVLTLAAVEVDEKMRVCHVNIPLMDICSNSSTNDMKLFIEVIAVRIFNSISTLWVNRPYEPVVEVSTQDETVAKGEMAAMFRARMHELHKLRFIKPIRKPSVSCLALYAA